MRQFLAATLLMAMVVLAGCRKPENDLGLALLDPADTLGTVRTDTNAIIAWPQVDEPVQMSGSTTNLLGSYVDGVFGSVDVGIATQLRLSVNNVGPADPSLVCDSLVLSFAWARTDPVYGELDPQVIQVYRLSQELRTDSIYKTNAEPVHDGINLVEEAPQWITPSPTQGPVVGADTLSPQVRIRLAASLGDMMLAQWGQPTLADNASFLEFFHGLAVVPDNQGQMPGQGGIWRLNLLDGNSKMTMYYHDGEGQQRTFDFIIGSSSVRYSFSTMDHDQANEAGLAEALADSTLGQQRTYVQALGGVRTQLRFPFLDSYRGSDLHALAKAELIVPISGTYPENLKPPSRLFIMRRSAEGEDQVMPGQVGAQGAVYDADKDRYVVNLTEWVQGVVNGAYGNHGLSLVPINANTTANRAVLAGPANTDGPMQLVLTFTTY